MKTIEHNKSLKPYNTFGFDQRAEHYAEISTDDELSDIVEYARTKSWPVFILGGGSNIVLTRDISGLVIRMIGTYVNRRIDSRKKHGELVTAAAGKNWHELVLETLDMNLPGLENLSLIPGTVGAAPVQNIGAYGVEVKDRLTKVRALHLASGEWHDFDNADCLFSYRHSYFKDNRGKYAITEVEFSLGEHCSAETNYQSLDHYLSSHEHPNPTARQISEAVVAIRQSKLPDPDSIGNAGSFFHNPVVSIKKAQSLKSRFPELVSFDAGPGMVKLSAAWLIDQLGYKGTNRDGVGVYQHQPLVLVHTGGSTGSSLLELANEIMTDVARTYELELTIEPMLI